MVSGESLENTVRRLMSYRVIWNRHVMRESSCEEADEMQDAEKQACLECFSRGDKGAGIYICNLNSWKLRISWIDRHTRISIDYKHHKEMYIPYTFD